MFWFDLRPDQSRSEPDHQILKTNFTSGDINDQIIHWLIILDIQNVPTALYQDFHEKPRSSFVRVDEAMISNHTMQDRCSLVCNWPMIS